jgi:hypothetical protein
LIFLHRSIASIASSAFTRSASRSCIVIPSVGIGSPTVTYFSSGSLAAGRSLRL